MVTFRDLFSSVKKIFQSNKQNNRRNNNIEESPLILEKNNQQNKESINKIKKIKKNFMKK